MDGNHIEVDRKMRTNLNGSFAAGDIVDQNEFKNEIKEGIVVVDFFAT